VATLNRSFWLNPRPGAVYNLGGGRPNSCSVVEAFERIESLSGKPMVYDYDEKPREGDHICYISNLAKIRSDYPDWSVTRSLDDIFEEIYLSYRKRMESWSVSTLGRGAQ